MKLWRFLSLILQSIEVNNFGSVPFSRLHENKQNRNYTNKKMETGEKKQNWKRKSKRLQLKSIWRASQSFWRHRKNFSKFCAFFFVFYISFSGTVFFFHFSFFPSFFAKLDWTDLCKIPINISNDEWLRMNRSKKMF